MSLLLTARSARASCDEDREAFFELGRLYVKESKSAEPFDEAMAHYLYAGIARADPAIHLLQAGDEIVGFSLIFGRMTPLTGARVMRQELMFVRADHRCAEAELRLYAMAQEGFEFCKPAEAFLLVQPSDHAVSVHTRLIASGYVDAGARMLLKVPVTTNKPRDAVATAALH